MKFDKSVLKFSVKSFILALCLSFIFFTGYAQLFGTYTIDPAGGAFPNFVSFQAAIDSLHAQGVDGAVEIYVADGVYNERVTINQISGVSASNRITFQSASDDSTSVTITFNSPDNNANWTLRLNGADYTTIRKIRIEAVNNTYCRAININGEANYNIIENCQLDAVNCVSNSYAEVIASFSDKAQYNIIRNNYIRKGTHGIFMNGLGLSDPSYGTQVIGNTFIDQTEIAIELAEHYAPRIENNTINSTAILVDGMYVRGCNGTLKVIGNRIILSGGGSGIEFYRNTATPSEKSLIENNAITIGGTGEATGIFMRTAKYVNIFHNSVNITSTAIGTNVGAMFQGDHITYGYSDIVMKNNVFVNSGGGYAILSNQTVAFTESDYNIFYSTGGTLAAWDGDRQDLEALQTASSMDVHSTSIDPVFVSSTNLLPDNWWLDGKGDPASSTQYDIGGISRLSPPDIGAFEFDASQLPLAEGTYTIGGTSPDYATVSDAIDDMNLLGIAGSVTFEIRDGYYNECVSRINQIMGASASDTIVLKSESGNSTIHFSTDEIVNRSIINLFGTDHFTLMDLTISSTGAEFGRPIKVRGTCQNLNFLNNTVASNNIADNAMSIWGGATKDITIKNNYFSKGRRNLFVYTDEGVSYGSNTLIEDNTLVDGHEVGIMVRYQISPIVRNNVVTNSDDANFYGIWTRDCENALEITGNKVSNESGGYGVRLGNCDAVLPFKGLIANNMVHVGGGAVNSYGIQIDDCKRQDIFYNSVHLSSADPNKGRAIYSEDDNEEINIINNILANSGGGYAMFVNDAADITSSDNNGFYAAGTNLANWGGTDYSTLGDLRGESGMDANSLVTEPMFYSETDLRTLQVDFHQAAQPLSEVEIDIDSVMRDANTPDIGAMEFSCGNPDYDIDVSITCFGDSTTFIDKTTGIVPLSVVSWDFNNDFEYDYTSPGTNDTVTWLIPAAGDNTVNYIIDNFACSPLFTQLSVSVNEPPNLDVTIEGAYCGNGDGEASLEVSGGAAPYDILWSTGSTETSISGLSLGTYTVGVIDQNSCDSSAVIVIEERMVVDVEQLSSSSCGASDGSAIASASGGTAPYKYVWSNSIEDASNDSLSPGIHTVYVEDNDGCNVRGVINIESDGSGPEITLVNRENNECFGEHQGVLEIDVTGGSTPYTILWSNGGTTEMIDDLAAGLYDVIVKDQEDCETYASYPLGQGARINIGTVVQESNCASSDGKAVAVVSGGTSPYNYLWSSGGEQQIEEDLEAGVYSLTVTDYYGCQMVHPVVVNDIAGPAVSLKSITGVNCAQPAIGAIDINISGGTPLYSYLWAPGGETSQDITGLTAGSYSVKATDNAGCVGAGAFDVKEEGPAVQPICIVSVDTLTGKNLLIWPKDYTDNVSHYNIYRETSSSGSYQLIDTVGVNSESIYLDEVADPSIRSWRYKLSVVDVCGEESELSPHHKTMHLTMNKGVGGVVNLIWDHYEGFTVSTYKVWRYDANSNWVNIEDMPSNLTSYTDLTPPNEDLTYYIEVLHPGGCEASEKKPGRLNSSKSNRKSSKKSGTKPESIEDLMNITEFSIYPNPGTGIFNLDLEKEGLREARIKVYDITGKVLSSAEYFNIQGRIEKEIDLSGYADGLYQVQIEAGNVILHRILIKE